MIEIDILNHSYKCPFCGHSQSYVPNYQASSVITLCGFYKPHSLIESVPEEYKESAIDVYTLKCANVKCQKIAVTSVNMFTYKQVDIVPQVTVKRYPDYIPEQIRRDYEEASMILEASPKAAATLLRRCLQGMIRDFWKVKKGRLVDEVDALKDKVTPVQWNAIDGLRKIGNIGAHMERDVNLIIDIDTDEAKKLLKLIELLFDKWYIARHDEEALFNDIVGISDDKEADKRKKP